ncbi:hypothetical protein CFB81_05820 [Burkholderia sp. AU28863]|nr:hypothetical protein CFB81_05820 [Burkholderia sp. AU28863]
MFEGATTFTRSSGPPMPLTDTAIRNAEPGARPQKLFDGGGLFLLVTSVGQPRHDLKATYGRSRKFIEIYFLPSRRGWNATNAGPSLRALSERQRNALSIPTLKWYSPRR